MSAHKNIPKKTRIKVYEKYGGRCAYCGCKLEYKRDYNAAENILQRGLEKLAV